MRESIKGELVITKDVWMTLEFAYRDFSDKLSGLLNLHKAESIGPLADALRTLADESAKLANDYREIKLLVKKGRPKVKPTPKIKTSNALVALGEQYELRKRPGRPTTRGAKFDKLTFKVVEGRRQELAQTNKAKPTIKAAIDSLNAEAARENSKQEGAAIKGKYERVHSAYKRGKKLLVGKSKLMT